MNYVVGFDYRVASRIRKWVRAMLRSSPTRWIARGEGVAQIDEKTGEVTFTLSAFGAGKTPSIRSAKPACSAPCVTNRERSSSSATASRCVDESAHELFDLAFFMTRPAINIAKVLTHLRKNEWDKAHAIVMGMRDKLAFRIHGLLHRIEGDLDNARYWYARAAVPFVKSKSAASEIEEIAVVLRRRAPLRASPPRLEQAHAARHRDVQALDAPAHRDAYRRSQRSARERGACPRHSHQHPCDRRGSSDS